MDEAYARLPGSDVLDLGAEGGRRWAEAREGYDRRVDGLEARVSALLEGRLRAARTAEEMFRVFAKFNPLFVRPRCVILVFAPCCGVSAGFRVVLS